MLQTKDLYYTSEYSVSVFVLRDEVDKKHLDYDQIGGLFNYMALVRESELNGVNGNHNLESIKHQASSELCRAKIQIDNPALDMLFKTSARILRGSMSIDDLAKFLKQNRGIRSEVVRQTGIDAFLFASLETMAFVLGGSDLESWRSSRANMRSNNFLQSRGIPTDPEYFDGLIDHEVSMSTKSNWQALLRRS